MTQESERLREIAPRLEVRSQLLDPPSDDTVVLYSAKFPSPCLFTYMSKNVKSMTGFTAEEFVVHPGFWLERVHPDDRETLLNKMEWDEGVTESGSDYRFLAADGVYRWIRDKWAVRTDETGRPIEVLGCWSHDQLAAKERVESLARALLVSQEDERRHIARDLHDDVNQRLAALLLEISDLAKRIVDPDLVRQLNLVKQEVASISDDVRRIAENMHSVRLEQLGLVAVLKCECVLFQLRQGVRVDLAHESGANIIRGDVGLGLYRIAQEALANVARHAKAQKLFVRLEALDSGFALTIADDGRGFDLHSRALHQGLGLTSMNERACLLGGRFSIWSQPAKGTTIKVWVPSEAKLP